jgi:hypothetical protein
MKAYILLNGYEANIRDKLYRCGVGAPILIVSIRSPTRHYPVMFNPDRELSQNITS